MIKHSQLPSYCLLQQAPIYVPRYTHRTLWMSPLQSGHRLESLMQFSEQVVQRHTCPQGTTAIIAVTSWQTTQVLLFAADSGSFSRLRSLRERMSGGITSSKARLRLCRFVSISLISLASSRNRCSRCASSDEIWVAASCSILSLCAAELFPALHVHVERLLYSEQLLLI